MKKINRFFAFFLAVLMLFSVIPAKASANGPAPSPWYNIELTNLPKGTVYVDMLIYLPEDDPMYTEPEAGKLPEGFSQKAEIITYGEEDYRSYTFHYRDALSVIDPDKYSTVLFFTDDNYDTVRYDHADDIAQRGNIRLAMLDKAGNIIKVSPILSLDTREFLADTLGGYHYDAATDEWEVETYVSGITMILYMFISIVGVVLTCILETIVAGIFRLGKQYSTLVTVTNLISQILMRIAFIVLYDFIFWKYSYAVFVLELCVYAGEYLVYSLTMRDISWKRRLPFVICANTISLVLGNYVNYSILFN